MSITLLAVALVQAAASPAPPTPPAAPAKKICRRPDATGSILQRKICRTAADWAQMDAQHASNAENALNRRRNQGLGLRDN